MTLIKPNVLSKGNKVAIVAPAGRVLKTDMLYAEKILKGWGLEVVEGKHLYKDYYNFSANDEGRAADFQEALDNAEIRAIFCARGGYGAIRIVDDLDFTKFLANPKWVIGYSDITLLHAKVNKLGIASVHGTMPAKFSEMKITDAPLVSLKNALFGKELNYTIADSKYNRKGMAKGELIGGNLSILYSLMGSDMAIDGKGKILFIEDLSEYLYHIDRMMIGLKRSGVFNNLEGLLIGGFSDMKDNAISFGKTVEEIVLDAVKHYSFPVAFGFPAGHIADNRAMILGSNVVLEVNEGSILNFK